MRKQGKPPFAANPQATVKRPRKAASAQATQPAAGSAVPAKPPVYEKQLDRTVTSSPINPPKGRVAEELTRSISVSKIKRKGK